MQPLVSVIIPVYNCSDYLLRCLESVCGQSYTYLEIICVNDGSTDESGNILNKLAKKDSRLKIIHQKNAGAAVARNVALAHVTGEYIIMIDADDYVERNIIDKMISVAESSPADLVICGVKNIDNDGKSVESLPAMPAGLNNSFASDFFQRFNPGPVAKLYKTEIIRKYFISFPVGVVMGEDAMFVATYWHYTSKVYAFKESLYFYDKSNSFSATAKFKSGRLSFAVYEQTLSLPCVIFNSLKNRNDGVKTIHEWLPVLLKMQLIEHEWVMDSVFSDSITRAELKRISRDCYKQLALHLTLYYRLRVNILFRFAWLYGRIMRIAGKVKRFLSGTLSHNK